MLQVAHIGNGTQRKCGAVLTISCTDTAICLGSYGIKKYGRGGDSKAIPNSFT